MKWLAALALAGQLALPSFIAEPSAHRATGSRAQQTSVSLESLFVQADSQSVAVLTSAAPGHYRGTTISHGVQLGAYNNCTGHAEFQLKAQYDDLAGTLYSENTNAGQSLHVSIYDTSDPTNKNALFGTDVPALGQVPFHLRVHGVTYLTIASENGCNGPIDVVARLTRGAPVMTQVVPRYPTGNAGVPANSKVLFGWQPFPHATNYALHIWLTGLSGSATVTGATPLTFAATIHHKTSYTWNDQGFLPGTYDYSLLPLDDSGHNLAGWSTPTQITIASS